MPIDLETLLRPVSAEQPAGEDLRHHPVALQIREARRAEEDVSQGVWKHDVKTADYPLVVKLAKELLAKRGKDLQVAAWLTEALLALDGFPGLLQGLRLIQGLLDRYWDSVHPQPDEDGDLDFRAVPLRWVATQLDPVIRAVPLSAAGHGWRQYKESRTIPSEEDGQRDSDKQRQREEALAEGAISPEEFEAGFQATPPAFYSNLGAELAAALELVAALAEFCDAKFGDASPDFGPLRNSLEEIQQTVRVLSKKRGAPEPARPTAPPPPPPVEAPAPEPAYEAPPPVQYEYAAAAPAPAPAAGDVDQAYDSILSAVRYLRRETPGNIAAFLLPRALRFGELRSVGADLESSFLEAPAPQVRMELKRLAAEEAWERLLEAAEEAAAQPCGRGWLDLQRYAVTACRATGNDSAAAAILAELRALLADYPQLPEVPLSDDTPAANAETRQWLAEEGLLGGAAAAPAFAPSPAEAAPSDNTFELALEAARSGGAEQAVDLMSAAIARETSGRGRFLKKLQLAQVCLEMSRTEMALPMLRELTGEIETRSLENWESAATLAQAWALLYASMSDGELDPEERRKVYARLCSLDPSRAVRLAG